MTTLGVGGLAYKYGLNVKVHSAQRHVTDLNNPANVIYADLDAWRNLKLATMTGPIHLGRSTTAYGYDSTSKTEATAKLLKNYPPLGILDRTLRSDSAVYKTKIGNLEQWFYAYYLRCIYNPKQSYWDALNMCMDPKEYVALLSLWPTANIGLSRFMPFGGMDINNPRYAGVAWAWRGNYDIPTDPLSAWDVPLYAGAVERYADVVFSIVHSMAIDAANKSGFTDLQSMSAYFSTISAQMNTLNTIHQLEDSITVWDKISGNVAYTIPMKLPHRLFTDEQAKIALTQKDATLSESEQNAKNNADYEYLRPIRQGEILPSPSEAAAVTIPLEVNGNKVNLSVQGAIAYFTGLASYILIRQQEKVYSRVVQLSDAKWPLQMEDCIMDPTRNIFLNIDWATVERDMTRAYLLESKSDATVPQEARRFIASAGPSAAQMLKARADMPKMLSARKLMFVDPLNPIGAPQDQSGGNALKYLALAAAAVAGVYAYKEGHI